MITSSNKMEASKSRKDSRRKKLRKPLQEQKFSNYLVFGFGASMCLASFLLCYALVLLCLWPLLKAQPENIPHETPQEYMHNLHVPVSLKEAHVPGQEKLGRMAGAMKERVNQLRQGRGVTDAQLLEQAKNEFAIKIKERQEREHKAVEHTNAIVGQAPENQRSGFMVLGMHRSGTSMLSGLLVSGCGYNVGKSLELIGASFDNEKGFFERVCMMNERLVLSKNE
jgi:hypothetical protein